MTADKGLRVRKHSPAYYEVSVAQDILCNFKFSTKRPEHVREYLCKFSDWKWDSNHHLPLRIYLL